MTTQGRSSSPDWYPTFVEELRTFADGLPANVRRTFVVDGDNVSLVVEPPTPAHRRLGVAGSPGDFEYQFGKLWTENLEASAEIARELLAWCDAVREGRVREVKDRRTGLTWHIYRLKSRGLERFARDSQYSLWRYLNLRPRNVRIHRIPPLAELAS